MSKFYCGDKDEIPNKYSRRGSRLECIRRGVGVGMYLKEKELGIAKVPIIFDENEEEREMRLVREEKIDENIRDKRDIKDKEKYFAEKDKYKKFIDENFYKAKSKAKNLEIGDLFKELAIMWNLKNKINKEDNNYNEDYYSDEDYSDEDY